MDFNKFSSIELKNIVDDNNFALVAFIEFQDDLLNNISSFREHAFAEYLNRFAKSKTKINDIELNFVFKYINPKQKWTSIAKGFLGEFAKNNILSYNQCKECLMYLVNDDWSYDQLLVRTELLTIDKVNNEIISFILDKRATWALYEILPNLNIDLIIFLKNELENKKLLYRSDRNTLLQILNKIIKVYEKRE